jgi:hypothetical protein
MIRNRASLETEFLRLCRERGEAWIESVIRPLQLDGQVITPRDIPLPALAAIVRMFGNVARPARGVAAV